MLIEEGQTHNCQKKTDKRTESHLKNTTQQTNDRSTRTHWNPGLNLGALIW